MGGWGSGRGRSGKDTTSDYRALDVRRLQRDGLLTPGRSFGWNWTRDGETVASIERDAVANIRKAQCGTRRFRSGIACRNGGSVRVNESAI